MASDSQSTEMTGDVRWPVQKVFQLSSHAVWGGSGQGQILKELEATFTANRDNLDKSPDMAQSLVYLTRPVLEPHYKNFLQPVPGAQSGSPATGTLAAGCREDGSKWIVEVDHNCQYTFYEDRGFHAIGSAAGFAQLAAALMAHYAVLGRDLEDGKLIAYRVIRRAIDTSAHFVGGDIQMWTVTPEGVHKVDDEEMHQLEANVGAWEQVEVESLDRFRNPEAGEEAPPLPDEVEADASEPDDS